MTDRELFHETFSCLHASDTIYEEVLEMAENSQKKRRRYITKKMAAVCAIAVAFSGITVLAAVKGSFFQSIWGTKGQADVDVHTVTEGSQSWTAPSRKWENANEAEAEKLAGEYLRQIDDSVTVYGYTLTANEYIIDENGIGAVTYTLSNPNGLTGINFNEYGAYYLSPECPMKEIYMQSTGEKGIDCISIADLTQTTDTELHAVMYFAPFERLDQNEGILIRHSGYESNANGEILSKEEQDITFLPDSFVTSETYTSASGYTAHISPIGILIDGPVFEAKVSDWSAKKLQITYTDGSVYQAQNQDVYNQVLGCRNASGGHLAVFNQLVDTERIASITINGPGGEDMIFTAVP
ncbi:MAG: DUF4179 domain-containing protein [Lachnospiraceae bacterium]|nr:DUF4179 domain-containing protein [Lachnospiraceae bacterium]